jgi:hypothetical protein
MASLFFMSSTLHGAQVRALLSLDAEVLLYRPEQLELNSADVAAELGAHEVRWPRAHAAQILANGTPLSPLWTALVSPRAPSQAAARSQTQLVAAALRDKVLGPKLQRAREALVPSKLSEPAFWDHFFSHVDVIKVRAPRCMRAAQCTRGAPCARPFMPILTKSRLHGPAPNFLQLAALRAVQRV